MNRASILIPGLIALLSAPIALAADDARSTWTVGVAAGISDDFPYYTYRGSFAMNATGGWLASLSVRRSLSRFASLSGEVSYLRYGGWLPVLGGLSSSSTIPRAVSVAEIPSIGLGVRLELKPRPDRDRRGVYLDILPAVFLAHWIDGAMRGDEWTAQSRSTKVAAGFILNAGLQLPVTHRTSLELGPRYVRSLPLGWSQYGRGTSEGLNTIGLSARVSRAI